MDCCCTRITRAEHNNKQQFEVAPRCSFAEDMEIAARVNCCIPGTTALSGRLHQHHQYNIIWVVPISDTPESNTCSRVACSTMRMRANARGCKTKKRQPYVILGPKGNLVSIYWLSLPVVRLPVNFILGVRSRGTPSIITENQPIRTSSRKERGELASLEPSILMQSNILSADC